MHWFALLLASSWASGIRRDSSNGEWEIGMSNRRGSSSRTGSLDVQRVPSLEVDADEIHLDLSEALAPKQIALSDIEVMLKTMNLHLPVMLLEPILREVIEETTSEGGAVELFKCFKPEYLSLRYSLDEDNTIEQAVVVNNQAIPQCTAEQNQALVSSFMATHLPSINFNDLVSHPEAVEIPRKYHPQMWEVILEAHTVLSNGLPIPDQAVSKLILVCGFNPAYAHLLSNFPQEVTFTPIRFLGAGGNGRIEQISFRGGPAALKTINLARSSAGMLLRELAAMEAMKMDPNYVALVGVQAPNPFELQMVMELLDGIDGWTLFHRLGRLSPELAGFITRQILISLHRLHMAGIVHGDIKPDNIFFLRNGQIKIMDYGHAFFKGHNSPGEKWGTPLYAPPELYDRNASPTDEFDLWAVGLMAYHMLTGQVMNLTYDPLNPLPLADQYQAQVDAYLQAAKTILPITAISWLERCLSVKLTSDQSERGRAPYEELMVLNFISKAPQDMNAFLADLVNTNQ